MGATEDSGDVHILGLALQGVPEETRELLELAGRSSTDSGPNVVALDMLAAVATGKALRTEHDDPAWLDTMRLAVATQKTTVAAKTEHAKLRALSNPASTIKPAAIEVTVATVDDDIVEKRLKLLGMSADE